jgi:DNA-binding NarL/FixJ family response regulator
VNDGQMASMRVFITSQDEKLRLALMMFVDKEPGMSVIGMADRLPGLLVLLQGSDPDVLLLDCDFSSRLRTDLLASLCTLKPRFRTIAFATRAEDEDAILKAGADYFIAKEAPPDQLLPILNEIMSSKICGGLY